MSKQPIDVSDNLFKGATFDDALRFAEALQALGLREVRGVQVTFEAGVPVAISPRPEHNPPGTLRLVKEATHAVADNTVVQ